MNKTLLSVALGLFVVAGTAHAAPGMRHNVTIDRTFTTAGGAKYTRHMEQTVTANGFSRTLVRTRPSGKSATRNTTITNDAAAKTRTREVSGTNFAGKDYSGKSVTTRTATGFERTKTMTGPAGKTRSIDTTVAKDAGAGTKTRTVTVTNPNGSTSTTTIARQLAGPAAGGASGGSTSSSSTAQ